MITEEQILEAQKSWGEGIINIGRVFLEKGDYKAAAEQHINTFYNYQEGKVLFKPTLASIKQFRLDFDAALSYFVGGNEAFPEDHGFAIKPWTDVRWENIGTTILRGIGSNTQDHIARGSHHKRTAHGKLVAISVFDNQSD